MNKYIIIHKELEKNNYFGLKFIKRILDIFI